MYASHDQKGKSVDSTLPYLVRINYSSADVEHLQRVVNQKSGGKTQLPTPRRESAPEAVPVGDVSPRVKIRPVLLTSFSQLLHSVFRVGH